MLLKTLPLQKQHESSRKRDEARSARSNKTTRFSFKTHLVQQNMRQSRCFSDKSSNVCVCVIVHVCLHFSRQVFIYSISNMVNIFLGTKANAVLSLRGFSCFCLWSTEPVAYLTRHYHKMMMHENVRDQKYYKCFCLICDLTDNVSSSCLGLDY